MKYKLTIILCIFSVHFFAQESNFIETEISIPSKKITINGTILAPENVVKTPLMILIPGSGNTDRDGNQGRLMGDYLKYLAMDLAEESIASFRYDKGTVELSKNENIKEEEISFDDFIDDAIAVIDYFKDKEQFTKIIIAGHSQGSLVGMIAAHFRADGFISLAGAGRPIHEILLEQLSVQAPAWKEEIAKTLDSLKNGRIDKEYNKLFYAIFRESLQPFLISWIKYDPQKEIGKLDIPVLIVNGSRDIQVPVGDAALLHKANGNSKLEIIEDMNHVFRKVTVDDRAQNLETYYNVELPIMHEVVTVISNFVNSVK